MQKGGRGCLHVLYFARCTTHHVQAASVPLTCENTAPYIATLLPAHHVVATPMRTQHTRQLPATTIIPAKREGHVHMAVRGRGMHLPCFWHIPGPQANQTPVPTACRFTTQRGPSGKTGQCHSLQEDVASGMVMLLAKDGEYKTCLFACQVQ
jgi:hypothetical protein